MDNPTTASPLLSALKKPCASFMLWAGISSEYSEYDCQLPNNSVLLNGTVNNSQTPCVQYTCQWGNLWTEGAPLAIRDKAEWLLFGGFQLAYRHASKRTGVPL
ncbi:uncharacterized protein LOC119402059 isoform X2 [Rhipicephalus sanguineus]|uniref:uncharacterized protein LOC119402059 isoform X2 n=1 Tax=Rhipicephalus sanguineus TaxID=34632 RepID=UPI001895D079|nr:uncharacterized protein LOC119402059 isoform X2 [Rhipicephalus sanguineus]